MEKIKSGEHFFYRDEDYIDDLEFIVLNVGWNSFYAISAELLPNKMPFDTGGSNNWETSSLREWLNKEFSKRLYHANLLCRLDGNLITILSEEEVEEYKNILPKYPTHWWTRSRDASNARCAWSVDPAGQLNGYYVINANGVSPAWTFSNVCMKIKDEDGRKIIYYE